LLGRSEGNVTFGSTLVELNSTVGVLDVVASERLAAGQCARLVHAHFESSVVDGAASNYNNIEGITFRIEGVNEEFLRNLFNRGNESGLLADSWCIINRLDGDGDDTVVVGFGVLVVLSDIGDLAIEISKTTVLVVSVRSRTEADSRSKDSRFPLLNDISDFEWLITSEVEGEVGEGIALDGFDDNGEIGFFDVITTNVQVFVWGVPRILLAKVFVPFAACVLPANCRRSVPSISDGVDRV
jgi:hypothetical protein